MELSRYHVCVPNYPGKGVSLLYSTLNGTALSISQKLYKKLLKGINERDVAEFPKTIKDTLKKYFIIETAEKEKQAVLDSISRSIFSKKRFALTVLTTTRCNFRCKYCYQDKILNRKDNMSESTLKYLDSWLLKKIELLRPENFELHLYGGEPLLNPKALWSILEKANKITDKYNTNFDAYMTTNGYLLTRDNASRLSGLGVKTVLISLDGPPEIHDIRRPLANGSGTFKTIMANIKESCEEQKICIRINVDKQNAKHIPKLFDILAHEGLQNKILVDIEVISPVLHASEHMRKFLFESNDDLLAIEKLWEKCSDRGFGIFGAMPIEGACEHKSLNTYTVDASGNLFKCPGFVGLKDFCTGNIRNMKECKDESLDKVYRPWMNCGDCQFLPLCQGGCRMCNYVTKKELETPFCKKSFFKQAFPGFLKAKYRNELKFLKDDRKIYGVGFC